ncbi:hypothetical protein Godav_009930 [Gossypium davidsonii]|uniref:Uncharacterized protein n=1 Tax=Gossypium davidsonii TaxID=34287 RepID=A0A7J8SFB2_GOSDV|nr:hypothetical protein [Gossypium davidsonii]
MSRPPPPPPTTNKDQQHQNPSLQEINIKKEICNAVDSERRKRTAEGAFEGKAS